MEMAGIRVYERQLREVFDRAFQSVSGDHGEPRRHALDPREPVRVHEQRPGFAAARTMAGFVLKLKRVLVRARGAHRIHRVVAFRCALPALDVSRDVFPVDVPLRVHPRDDVFARAREARNELGLERDVRVDEEQVREPWGLLQEPRHQRGARFRQVRDPGDHRARQEHLLAARGSVAVVVLVRAHHGEVEIMRHLAVVARRREHHAEGGGLRPDTPRRVRAPRRPGERHEEGDHQMRRRETRARHRRRGDHRVRGVVVQSVSFQCSFRTAANFVDAQKTFRGAPLRIQQPPARSTRLTGAGCARRRVREP